MDTHIFIPVGVEFMEESCVSRKVFPHPRCPVDPGRFGGQVGSGRRRELTGLVTDPSDHPNFRLPDNNRTSPTFGKFVDASDARINQLALRLDF